MKKIEYPWHLGLCDLYPLIVLFAILALTVSCLPRAVDRSRGGDPGATGMASAQEAKLRSERPTVPPPEVAGVVEGEAGGNEDFDMDGLTDAEEAAAGTDSSNSDTDGDALLDGWEVKGVNGLDLPKLGANPLRMDIFVEMDFMVRATATNSLGPNANVLQRIEQVFAAAPVTNPDGSEGITIHLELGNEVPHDADLNPYLSEFQALKDAHFAKERLPVYHYMIWADGYTYPSNPPTRGSSGISMDIPHSDFLVTLGKWNSGRGGTDEQKIGTFIHELGHNLGRRHGGSDDENYKPNHLSVMNYSWQMRGLFRNGAQGHFDYQRFPIRSLREPALSEAVGLSGGAELTGYQTRLVAPNGAPRQVPAQGAIDWNQDGDSSDVGIHQDLNNNGVISVLAGTPHEWAAIVFNGGAIGSTQNLDALGFATNLSSEVLPFVELTEEMDRQLSVQASQ